MAVRSLGVDLSTHVCGYGLVVNGLPSKAHGVIEPKEQDFWKRQHRVATDIKALFRSLAPDIVVMEHIRLFHQRKINIRSIVDLSRISGTIGYLATVAGIPILEVHTSTWRKAIIGSGKATKDDVVRWCTHTCGVTLHSSKPDEAEAIALAVYGYRVLTSATPTVQLKRQQRRR